MPDHASLHASLRIRRNCAFLVSSLLLALSSGCVQRTINVTSDPPGALVYWNDQEIGRTPFRRDFTWYGTYDVQVRRDGFGTLNTRTRLIAPWWQWPPIDFFAELWPWHFKDERWIAYKLEPASTDPPDPQVMLLHAAELKTQLESSQYTTTKPVTTRPATRSTTKSSTRATTGATTTTAPTSRPSSS
jgi:PEGA domain